MRLGLEPARLETSSQARGDDTFQSDIHGGLSTSMQEQSGVGEDGKLGKERVTS